MTIETPLIDIRPDHWEIVRGILKKHVPQYTVWAFGSRATWKAKEFSDLDLVIITDQPLSLSVSASLSEDFSESDLPYKVDVVDWATTSESFRKIIERDKVVVQEGSKGFGWASEWRLTTVGRAFNINPLRPLKRGSVSPFIPMDVLPLHSRAVERIESREYTGSGMRFCNGDTLIARITPCLENGKTAFVSGLHDGEIAHGSTEYIVLSGKAEESDSLFGYYLARSPEFRRYAIGHMEGTSGRQRVPSSAIERFPIKLPPIEEQRAIAHILGTLDDKIELNRKQNETLEAMARALFKAWFVDFEPVRAKMEGLWQRGQSLPGLPAQLYDIFPNRLVDTDLGQVPEGWEMRSLDTIASYLNGLALQKFPPENEGEFLPVIKIAQLRAGNTNGADKASLRIKPEYVVVDGDVLFSWSGSLEVEVWNGGRGALNQHLFKVTSDKVPKWFYLFATRHHLQGFREIAADKATTMGHIQRKHLTDARIAVAPQDGIKKLDAAIAPLFEQMVSNSQQSRLLAQLRDTLLPKLIFGELSVLDVEQHLQGCCR